MERGSKGSAIFWGVVAAGAVATGLLVAVLAGYLLGHYTGHETTVTVGQSTTASTTASTSPIAPAFTAVALAAHPGDNWITNGGGTTNNRYSPLKQIDTGNIAKVKGDWMIHLKSGLQNKYSLEGQPIAYNGTLYVVTGADDVSAVDQATGAIKWTYKANLPASLAGVVCCGWDNRGVAIGDGKVYSGQLDGKLVALDQSTGDVAWKVDVGDPKEGFTVTAAPLYYDGKVYIGPAGAEYGVRGYMDAYDAQTGKRVWRHYNVPAPGEPGSETWPSDNDSWKHGGATVWNTPTADPKLGLIYYATGNLGNDWDGRDNPGDNQWSSSILAVDAKTGKQRWGYQTVHHDIWDYDATSPTVLIDETINGQLRHGIAQPGKTGYVYFVDRETGKPIFPIPEKPVPQSTMQNTSPTQPIPTMAPFSDLTVTPAEAAAQQKAVDAATPKGKKPPKAVASPIFTPYNTVSDATIPIDPTGAPGGNNWPPSGFNPTTHMYYVCSQSSPIGVAIPDEPNKFKLGESYTGAAIFAGPGFNAPGEVTAYDMRTGKIAWQKKFPDSCYSGAVSTAGNLLFIGRNKGELEAYNATTGQKLWGFQTGAGANATATIYTYRGQQKIAYLAGGNALAGTKHGDRLWTFSLDGTINSGAGTAGEGTAITHAGEGGGGGDVSTTSTTETQAENTSTDQQNATAGGDAAAGKAVFTDNCSTCHGVDGKGGNGGPDLTGIPSAKDLATVVKQVNNGGGGMPAFKGQLTNAEIQNVATYVTQQITNK